MDDTTDIPTEGITTHTAITGATIGTGPGLSPSTGARVIIAIGKRPHDRRDHASEPIATSLYFGRKIFVTES